MNFNEILKNYNLNDEQIKAIISDMKSNKIYTTSLENIEERYSKLKSQKEDLSSQLTKANDAISNLKQFEKDNEQLKGKLQSWEQEKTIFEKQLAEKDFNYALDKVLESSKAKNVNLVKALLERDKLSLKDGKIDGIEAQIDRIKKENDFLFEKEIKGTPDFRSGGNGAVGGKPVSLGERLGKNVAQAKQASSKLDDFFK